MKKVLLFLLIITISAGGLFYYFSSPGNNSSKPPEPEPSKEVKHEYEPETGGINQVAAYKLQNDAEKAVVKLELAVLNPAAVNFSYRILTATEPIYAGEGKQVEPALGAYRVELLLSDMRLQKQLVTEVGTRVVPVSSNQSDLLQAIKVSYPQDDASLIIYLGCRVKPEVTVSKGERSLTISLTAGK